MTLVTERVLGLQLGAPAPPCPFPCLHASNYYFQSPLVLHIILQSQLPSPNQYSQLHCSATHGQLPPHIFAVARSAYQAMVQECRDQCCVVSGESGAGKTEASNILVQQFMKLGRAETRSLEEKILKVL